MVAEGGEGENPLPFSLTAPKRGGGGGGGGGRAGFVSLQVPTSEAAVSADTHAFARLPPENLRKIVIFGFCGERSQAPSGAGPQALGGRAPSPGALAPSPLETWPTGPWPGFRHSHRSQIYGSGSQNPRLLP